MLCGGVVKGRVFVVVGPSGAGKDTLIAGACGSGGPHWVRRVITRAAEPGGEPFESVCEAEFRRRRDAGAFALDWCAHGLRYGLPHAEFAPLDAGRDVLFNGSRAILDRAARLFPCLHILHVSAPPEVLASRLAARGRESAADIASRLARDAPLPRHLPATTILNDSTPEAGVARMRAAIHESPTRCSR